MQQLPEICWFVLILQAEIIILSRTGLAANEVCRFKILDLQTEVLYAVSNPKAGVFCKIQLVEH
jgi:hypothetical protein